MSFLQPGDYFILGVIPTEAEAYKYVSLKTSDNSLVLKNYDPSSPPSWNSKEVFNLQVLDEASQQISLQSKKNGNFVTLMESETGMIAAAVSPGESNLLLVDNTYEVPTYINPETNISYQVYIIHDNQNENMMSAGQEVENDVSFYGNGEEGQGSSKQRWVFVKTDGQTEL